MGVMDDLFNIGNGIRSGIADVPSLLENIVTLDPHGVVTDGRKIIGDVGDVLGGVGQLGIDVGKVPAKYLGTFGKFADSPILSAAQLTIEGEKALTGTGEPTDGTGYVESAKKLRETVQHLSEKAKVNSDLWSGEAANAYTEAATGHASAVSSLSDGDQLVGDRLDIEAGQVSRARKTLDDTSQYLYDYGLATAWMNFVPGLNLAKIAADTAAASAALATTNTTMLVLTKNAAENAMAINEAMQDQAKATTDTSGDKKGGPFVSPADDQKDNLPPRLQPGTKYTYPEGIPLPPQYPPAIPYETPGQ
jgi:hypothetical protein